MRSRAWPVVALLVCAAGVYAQETPLANDAIEPGAVRGKSDHTPYKGQWYQAEGREMPEALEKFSKFLAPILGFNPLLHEIEKFTHYVGEGSPIWPKMRARGITEKWWFGHCNGTGAASCLEKNPPDRIDRDVEGTTLTFTGEDSRALLGEAYYRAGAVVRGQRSFLSWESVEAAEMLLKEDATLDKWQAWYKEALKSDAPSPYTKRDLVGIAKRGIEKYKDIRPDILHRYLLTAIGKAKIPMIVEISTGVEVFNFAADEFESTGIETGRKTEEGLRIFEVETTVNTAAGQKTYTYELLLDAEGRAQGGEWIGASVRNHPDFTWSPLGPSWKLNEVQAEAVSNNLGLDFTDAELLEVVTSGKSAGYRKLRKSIDEVVSKIAPTEVVSAKVLSNRIYQRVKRLLRDWDRNPWARYQYGWSLEAYIQNGLKHAFTSRLPFDADLYELLSKHLLPEGNRAVADPLAKLEAAARGETLPGRASAVGSLFRSQKSLVDQALSWVARVSPRKTVSSDGVVKKLRGLKGRK